MASPEPAAAHQDSPTRPSNSGIHLHKPDKPPHIFKRAALAASAGIFTKTAVAPLERIKMLFQIQRQRQAAVGSPLKYTSLIQAGRHILRHEGFLGFYMGNGANVARIIPNYALKFSFNDTFKMMVKRDGQSIKNLDFEQLILSGSLAGVINVVACSPFEVLRTRLAMPVDYGGRYKGIVDCTLRTVREEGFASLYKGLGPALVTTVPYIALQMTFYDVAKRNLPQNEDGSTTIIMSLLAGSIAGFWAQTLCYPGDTLRRHLQTNGVNGEKKLYTGMWDCMKQILKREGIQGLYRGLPINAIKCIPEAGIQFATYDFLKARFL